MADHETKLVKAVKAVLDSVGQEALDWAHEMREAHGPTAGQSVFVTHAKLDDLRQAYVAHKAAGK